MQTPRANITLYLTDADLAAVEDARQLYEGAQRHLVLLAALRRGLQAIAEDPTGALALVADQSRAKSVRVRTE